MAANPASAAPRSTTCATTWPASIFAYRTVFADALKTVDAGLDDLVTARIEQLKTIVTAADLPHVDIRALRRASEELVVALQAASAKLGLHRPTLEAQSR